MPVEVCSYRLSSLGKPVGTHVLTSLVKGRSARLESRLQLQGALGQWTVLQQSRCHSDRFHSHYFYEENQRHGERRTYEVTFDPADGLVKAKRNQKDAAEEPYLLPYRDPLSLLFELRRADVGEQRRVPMLGKEVVAQRLGQVELETGLGKRTAVAYTLHPGGSYLYVDEEAPHHLLKLTQRIADGWVDAVLVTVGSEAESESDGKPGGKRKRSRRRRRRRK